MLVTKTHRILVIDDNPSIHEDYRKSLLGTTELNDSLATEAIDEFFDTADEASDETHSGLGNITLDSAYQGEEGLEKIRQAIGEDDPYSLVFVDMRMPPGWDGLQTIQEIWKVAPEIHAVICTAYSDRSWREITSAVGRTDKLLILKKPFEKIEVAQITVALTEKSALAKLAELKREDLERLVENRTKKWQHAALHDWLTDLPNRKQLQARLVDVFNRNQRTNSSASVLMLDLDGFKYVNDTFGHAAGDALLVAAGKRLKSCVREDDMVARLGGDEFVVVRENIKDELRSHLAINRIQEVMSKPYEINGKELKCGVSMGVATIPYDGSTPEELLRKSDIALYRAKQNGRGQYRIFDKQMDAEVIQIRQVESDLRNALANNELVLWFQPLVNSQTLQVCAYEALLRWQHPERGLLAPDKFIDIAESTEMIIPIGEWVVQEACRQATNWPEHIRVAVNASAVQFRDSYDFANVVFDALREHNIATSRFEVEITETVIIRDTDHIYATLNRLRDQGVQVTLDDFGVGYSSLSYLSKFPFSRLKLDRSFVQASGTSSNARVILRAVSALGEGLTMSTVAEGVETQEELERVRQENYTEMQGFLFGRPSPAKDLTRGRRELNSTGI